MPGPAARDDHDNPGVVISGAAVVRAQNITKKFPGIVAVDDVSLTISAGEIVALIGQNGAGKSTLIQILCGLHPFGSYEGDISIDGKSYRPTSVTQAEAAGIALVPQEINVAPDLSVAENMYLNSEPTRFGIIDQPLRLARARQTLRDFGLDVDPASSMRSLDLSTQQLVIIARALSKKARLLILDEPTAALTEEEAKRLFERMQALTARGVATIFVSHRLAEVFAISQRIVVMRDGRICGSSATAEVSRDAVVAQMVGEVPARAAKPQISSGKIALAVDNLTASDPNDAQRLRVDDISFTIAHGEILGLFGLLGAGCIEAALAVFGAWQGESRGRISIDGRVATITNPTHAVAHGMGLMAQDRRDCLLLEHSVHDNVILASLKDVSSRGFLRIAEARRRTSGLVARLDIKTRTIDADVGILSGGNQQKVQIARWLAAGAGILILIDPTRGVDVGARAQIKRVWQELRRAGQAILIASTDTEELVDICDRVLVLRHGQIAGEIMQSDLNENKLLRMATNV